MFHAFVATLAIFALNIDQGLTAGATEFWDYKSTGSYGPSNWYKISAKCNGTQQSPIDITTNNTVYDASLGDITFANYDAVLTGVNFTVKNTGRAFAVTFSGFTGANQPSIKDGGLPGTFNLAGFHFHWGSIDSRGAEHHVNSDSHAAELHFVHLNAKYNTVSDGKMNKDGLAVLGVFIDIGAHNEVFAKFLNMTTHNVTYPDQTYSSDEFALSSLLPTSKQFHRYNGSLTTPTCDEAVTWTLFRDDIEISADQMHEFRKMKYFDKMNMTQSMVDTHRPTQPLHGRKVLANFMTTAPTASTTTTSTSTTSNSAMLKPSSILSIITAYVIFIWLKM